MTLHIRLSKCKQHGKTYLSFRAGISDSEFHHLKFLNIQLKTKTAAIAFSPSEPNESWIQNAQAATLIRKYLDGSHLIAYQESNSIQQLFFRTDSSLWLLEIDCKEAPTLSLIDQEGKNYFRWSAAGTFTKPKILSDFSFPEIEQNQIELLLSTNLEKPNKQTLEANHFSELQRTLRDRLARQVKTLKKSLEKQQKITAPTEKAEQLKNQARFLQDHIHLIKEGELELRFDDQTIALDPDLSPGENVNRLFIKAKKSERASTEGSTRLAGITEALQQAETALSELRTREFTIPELNRIASEFKVSLTSKISSKATTTAKKNSTSENFREFLASDGSTMQLGRTAKENDQLTKQARSDDFWFHAVNASGAHVIVPKKKLTSRNELSSQTIREACILAIHFSKLANGRSGEVYVTTRGNLRKQKGMPDGLWQVLKCETLNIKYEKSEVDAIFSREKN